MVNIIAYNNSLEQQWDEFVGQAVNGTFLFQRQFMEYHSDRFIDASLLFYRDKKLIAILPANRNGDQVISHQGLTYGGLIYGKKTSTQDIIDILTTLKIHALDHGIKSIIFKVVPNIFRNVFSEDDIYALFTSGAKLTRRDLSFAIDLRENLSFTPDKRNKLRKFQRSGTIIKQETKFNDFMSIVDNNLSGKFGVNSAHTADEMELLQERFPGNVRLYLAMDGEETIGGAVCFSDNKFIHTQYLHASDLGRKAGVLEGIVDAIITDYQHSSYYLSFGTCTTNNGYTLNQGLASFKRGFGSFSLTHDFYELTINT